VINPSYRGNNDGDNVPQKQETIELSFKKMLTGVMLPVESLVLGHQTWLFV
jgi:hypothetical protein